MPQRLFYQDLITALDSDHRIAIGKPEVPGQVGCENIKWSDFLALLGSRRGQQDIASANTLTVDSSNQSIYITSISNELKLLNTDGFVDGDLLCIILNTGGRIKHNETPSGDNKPYLISGGNITVFDKTAFLFEAHDSTGDNVIDSWLEVGRSSSNEGDTTKVIFTVNVTAADVSGGTLTLTPTVTFSSGNVTLYDGNGNSYSLTSAVSQNIDYVAADLDGETERNFTWVLETDTPDAITQIRFNSCNISGYDSALFAILENLQLIGLANNRLEEFICENNDSINSIDVSTTAVPTLNVFRVVNCSAYSASIEGSGNKYIFLSSQKELNEVTIRNVSSTAFALHIVGCNNIVVFDIETLTSPALYASESSLLDSHILSLPNSTIYLDLQCVDTYSDISALQKFKYLINCTFLKISNNSNLQSDFQDYEFPSSLVSLYINNTSIKGIVDLSGITNFPVLNLIYAYNNDIEEFITRDNSIIEVCWVGNGNALLTKLDCKNATSQIGFYNYYFVSGANFSYIDIDSMTGAFTSIQIVNSNAGGSSPLTMKGLTNKTAFNLFGNGFSQVEVDSILDDIDSAGVSGGTISINSGNAGDPTLSPTYASLIGKGWSIT